jgi:hypothetical protein
LELLTPSLWVVEVLVEQPLLTLVLMGQIQFLAQLHQPVAVLVLNEPPMEILVVPVVVAAANPAHQQTKAVLEPQTKDTPEVIMEAVAALLLLAAEVHLRLEITVLELQVALAAQEFATTAVKRRVKPTCVCEKGDEG